MTLSSRPNGNGLPGQCRIGPAPGERQVTSEPSSRSRRVEGPARTAPAWARHRPGHKLEGIEVDRPNAGSPASPGRRPPRRSGDNRSRHGEPAVTSRSNCLANDRPSRSLAVESHPTQRRGLRRGRPPTLRRERLASPTWGEVTVNRLGGTTSVSGAPSSGRDAALNVARPARRHRPRNSPSHRTGHRRELDTVAGGRPVWRRRACGPPVGQEGGEGWAFARRTMSPLPSSLSSKRHRRQVSFVVAPSGATPPTNEHSPPGFSASCGRRALIVPVSP